MNRRDFIVIPVAAIAVMVLNVAISFGLVWLYFEEIARRTWAATEDVDHCPVC